MLASVKEAVSMWLTGKEKTLRGRDPNSGPAPHSEIDLSWTPQHTSTHCRPPPSHLVKAGAERPKLRGDARAHGGIHHRRHPLPQVVRPHHHLRAARDELVLGRVACTRVFVCLQQTGAGGTRSRRTLQATPVSSNPACAWQREHRSTLKQPTGYTNTHTRTHTRARTHTRGCAGGVNTLALFLGSGTWGSTLSCCRCGCTQLNAWCCAAMHLCMGSPKVHPLSSPEAPKLHYPLGPLPAVPGKRQRCRRGDCFASGL